MFAYNEILSLLNNSFVIFFYSLIGGIIPTLLWLWFWLQEDNRHKGSRKTLIFVFTLGMLGVFISFIIQKSFAMYFDLRMNDIGNYLMNVENHNIINLIYVIIEEFIKFLCAYIVFFRTKLLKEPIDAFIYLITAALGFAAMENSLYLIKPLIEGQTIDVIINSNIRFIGANLLHVASSGLLALFIGFSFCKKPLIREIYIWFGLISAVLLHWIFNLILIHYSQSIIYTFASVWLVIIYIILVLEKIKKIKCDI